jgi:hypothetical protein
VAGTTSSYHSFFLDIVPVPISYAPNLTQPNIVIKIYPMANPSPYKDCYARIALTRYPPEVYAPAEDSFALADAVYADAEEIQRMQPAW